MKRLIAAVSFAAFAVPSIAAEYGKPFEQLDLDRALPQLNISEVQSSGRATQVASSGSTRSDVEIAVDANDVESTGRSGFASGAWADDHNFIAPSL